MESIERAATTHAHAGTQGRSMLNFCTHASDLSALRICSWPDKKLLPNLLALLGLEEISSGDKDDGALQE